MPDRVTRDITLDQLASLVGQSTLDLIRRGADGSLRLSADRWRLDEVRSEAVVFRSLQADEADQPQVLIVALADVERMTWDRLPRQQVRSQLRFHLRDGDLWTFSGNLSEPAD